MRKFYLMVFCLLMSAFTKADDYDVLYQRLFDDQVSTTPPPQATLQGYMDTQQSNGSWTDINYDSHVFVSGWQPLTHLERLRVMAHAFKKPGNFFNGNATLKAKIKLGLTYWYNRAAQPYSDNWYDNDIAVPEKLYRTLILIKNDFATEPDWTNVIVTGVDKYLKLPSDYYTTYYKRTPTNAVWIARNLVHNGVIKKDPTKLQEGINNMAAELGVQPVKEYGIHRDNSYLIHYLQLYNGGYGVALMSDVSYYMYQTRGLTVANFSTANVASISDQVLKGDQWMAYGGVYDFSATGRNIARKGQIASTSLKAVVSKMLLIDPAKTSAYQSMYNHLNDPTGAVTGLTGNKHFWRADYMTQRRTNMFFGIKMCSKRTLGTEGINSENMFGHWLPFGATTIMRHAGEYKDIFALWDWTKIPGVTNPAVNVNWGSGTGQPSQTTSFVGGASNGTNGVAGMDLNRDTIINGVSVDIAGKKAYFLFNNEMICLGAGLNSSYTAAPTTTTLNQSFYKTSVLINGTTIPQGESTYTAKWIHHDNTGYVFRSNTSVKMKTNSQSGNWYTINKSQPDAAVSGDVFKLWLDHGAAPTNASYEYVVLPNYTSSETSTYSANMPIVTNANTTSLQSVTHGTLEQTGAVFYAPGTVYINTGLKVKVDKPCILLVDFSVNPLKITASDPTQLLTDLSVTVTYSNAKSETMVFNLPTGDMAGSSITKTAATNRLIDERFYGLAGTTTVSGGVWSIVNSELQLSNPAPNTQPTPANNMLLSNTAVSGDFVMTVKAKVTGTTSGFNDFCLIWNHQNPTNSYYYAHFSEANDATGSGVFKVLNGVQSAQLADIATAIVSDTWNYVEVKKVGTTMTIYINGTQVAQLTDASLANGLVGLGSYNDACQFDELSVLRYNSSLNPASGFMTVSNDEKLSLVNERESLPNVSVTVFPNPNSGSFNLLVQDSFIGSKITVYDLTGRVLFSGRANQNENKIDLKSTVPGAAIVLIEKDGNRVFKKILIQ